jgi:N-acetylglucosaminyldiphosphoundecaprenol N-acetyl-beta-D-mannosaminyltransferase
MTTLTAEPAVSRSFFRLLGSRIDRLTSDEAREIVRGLAVSDQPHHIVTANTLMILEAEKDTELRRILETAAVVVPESWGVLWASRRVGSPLAEFVPGIDLLLALCREAAQERQRVYLLGAKPGVAEAAANVLAEQFPGLTIVGARDGYFTPQEEQEVIRSIREAHPHYLFVGLSVPAQEKWIARHLRSLDVPVVMGVGGSFDVLAGRLKRAPVWMRRLGLEWVYRTLQEPWRLQRIKNLPVFMRRVLAQKKRDDRPIR